MLDSISTGNLPPQASGTRERIINAAAQVFAEDGYDKATVRKICGRAGVNVAAVNYHFRDKKSLYIEVLRYCREAAFKKYPPELGTTKLDSPELRLAAFIRSFILRILDEEPSSLFGRLVSREYVEPTVAFDFLVDEAVRPTFTLLADIVRDLLGANVPENKIRMYCGSIVSQCLFYLYARPALSRLFPEQNFGGSELNALVDHITTFSLSGMGVPVKEKKGETR